jgi:hypothetical protein
MLVVAQGWTILTMEIPVPATTDVAIVTWPRCEESRIAAAHRRLERHGPVLEVVLLGMAPTVAIKRASKCTPEKPLAGRPGPITATGKRDP